VATLPAFSTERAMQLAFIAQSLPKGERGRGHSGLFLLFRRRYPKGEDFRDGTGIRPDLALIYQE
jgi:hypothetical protein